jgi:cyanophycin synthetase
VAGRFDHYVCRRDDNLRDRAPDEVPRLIAAALREAGVPDTAISIVPDEQEAIDAALHMGRAGDLLLVFADALTRSWKQITKFRPAPPPSAAGAGTGVADAVEFAPSRAARAGGNGEQPPGGASGSAPQLGGFGAEATTLSLEGLVRDERGIHFAPETDD